LPPPRAGALEHERRESSWLFSAASMPCMLTTSPHNLPERQSPGWRRRAEADSRDGADRTSRRGRRRQGEAIMGNFWVTGIEVIQAVQTPDNAVPLIGHKPTFVRVYVQSDAPVEVSGRLDVQAPDGGVRHLSSFGSRVTATPAGSRRDQWGE